MKKFYVVLLSLIMCFVSICFVGCEDKENDSVAGYIDLAKMQEGDYLPINPNFEIDHKYTDTHNNELIGEYIFHVSSISVMLYKKNIIEQNKIVDGEFYPYEIKTNVSGYTTPSLQGSRIYVALSTFGTWCTIEEDGSFCGEQFQGFSERYVPNLIFRGVITLD